MLSIAGYVNHCNAYEFILEVLGHVVIMFVVCRLNLVPTAMTSCLASRGYPWIIAINTLQNGILDLAQLAHGSDATRLISGLPYGNDLALILILACHDNGFEMLQGLVLVLIWTNLKQCIEQWNWSSFICSITDLVHWFNPLGSLVEGWLDKAYGNHLSILKLHVDIPLFYEMMGVEKFLDWHINVDRFFDVIDVYENKKVKIMAIRLKSIVTVWWDKLVVHRQRQ
ncbi:hypothetical protein KIW84_053221 [Lathyrus oleraceus]|uniref:Uncharacterized protein n=1 Tax=Pisum sativum TaxID=3888 RepID=A0A9D5AG12_PEA|nr:hypothetical protein KIW84_053221 [Pisum sativum]